jgi:hypothetical protein
VAAYILRGGGSQTRGEEEGGHDGGTGGGAARERSIFFPLSHRFFVEIKYFPPDGIFGFYSISVSFPGFPWEKEGGV